MHEAVHGDGDSILTRIIQTCEEMTKDRGYERVSVVSDVKAALESGLLPVVQGRGKGGEEEEILSIYIYTEEKVGIKYLRTMEEHRKKRETVLIVSIDGPTPFARKECEESRIQFMNAKSLCVNKTHHFLVPLHTLVDSPPDNVPLDSLPKILDTDPIVQYYDFPKGSIVRIVRRFGGHEVVPYFRMVAAASS